MGPSFFSGGLAFYSNIAGMGSFHRANGFSVRLILNGTFTQQEFNDDYLGETIVIEGLTYGYVYNSTTNKIWLDRNLGATQVATSSTDTDAYGWLYQWGRLTDGHQIRTSTTTAILSSTDVPLTDDFITVAIAPFDWRTPQNDNLWQLIEKLIGKNGKKADYNDLLNLPALQDITTGFVRYDGAQSFSNSTEITVDSGAGATMMPTVPTPVVSFSGLVQPQ